MPSSANVQTIPERRAANRDRRVQSLLPVGVVDRRIRTEDRRVAKSKLYYCLRARMKQARAALLAESNDSGIVAAAVETAWDSGIDAICTGLAERMSPAARRKWLRVVTRHAILTLLRRKQAMSIDEDVLIPSTAQSAPGAEEVGEALKRLPHPYRAVIESQFIQGKTRSEIAEALGVSESAIWKWRKTALQLLKDLIQVDGK